MARTVAEIKKQITDRFIQEPVIVSAYGLDTALTFEQQFSVASIESILFYVVAFGINVFETILDIFRTDMQAALRNLKPGTVAWVKNKALAYQHGFPLLPDNDEFDNTGYTPTQIAASKIVKNAAVIEQTNQYGRVSLRIKLVREVGGILHALTPAQLAGAKAYLQRIKYAGVRQTVESLAADGLKLSITVYYDPLILRGDGARLDGTDPEPVQNAIRGYLKVLPFDGTLALALLTDAMQKVQGVVIPEITAASSQYGLFPYTAIATERNPDAGYFKLYNESTDLLLTYLPHNPF